jgi:hypothetical protein
MTQLYDPDLTQWLQHSGEFIGRLRPADERAEWILFLVDEVKAFLAPEDYARLLEELQAGLAARRPSADQA